MSSKHRRFDPISIPAEAGRRRVHRIACAECGAEADVSANTIGGSRAHDDLLRVWKRAGWEIGSNPNRDMCPTCVMARRKARKQAPEEQQPMKAEPLNAKVIPMPAPSPISAEPPRAPTFEEKRVINAKLDEVYLDETTGYAAGWSDKRVAEDLGVPRKWVETLREANFGPVKTNEEVLAAIEDGRKLLAETQRALVDARREAGAMRQRADALDKASAALGDRFAELERRLAVIEKGAR